MTRDADLANANARHETIGYATAARRKHCPASTRGRSMLLRMPAASNLSVNAALGELLVLVALKILAAPSAQQLRMHRGRTRYPSCSIDARSVHKGHSGVPVHHHDQVEETQDHWDVSNVGSPDLVRLINRQPAEQVGARPGAELSAGWSSVLGPAFRALSFAAAVERLAVDLMASLAQLHHSTVIRRECPAVAGAAYKPRRQILLVDPPHQRQTLRGPAL